MDQVVPAAILGFLAISGYSGLKPVETTDYLQIKCAAGTDLNLKTIKCDKPEKSGALVRITVNRTAGTVFLDVVENNQQFLGPWFHLTRCKVATFTEWRCGDTSISDKVDAEYGAYGGRFFQSVTGGAGANYYTASIHGLAMHAYRYDLISLKTAIDWD